MLCWGGGGADSLSKQTLEARLAVPELSDQFREICSEIAASSAGREGLIWAANEQRLSVLE